MTPYVCPFRLQNRSATTRGTKAASGITADDNYIWHTSYIVQAAIDVLSKNQLLE